MPNKEYIPHTDPDWDLELPEGYNNSLVDKHGQSHDDGFNFDEKDDEAEDDTLEFDPETARKAREEALKHIKDQTKYTFYAIIRYDHPFG